MNLHVRDCATCFPVSHMSCHMSSGLPCGAVVLHPLCHLYSLSCGGHIHGNTCALLMSTVPKTQAIHSHVLSCCLTLITIISPYLASHLGHSVSLFLHLACSLAEEYSHQVPGTAAHECRFACGCTQHHSVSLPGHWLQTLLRTCQHYR